MRIGHGYDVHRLVSDRDLFIGGVKIPYEKGLLGHSDADVLLHSVCDSLLGALALGDIGTHFPDSDDRYKGISSVTLLENVMSLVDSKGYKIVNIDCTIIAQEPKLLPYLPLMKSLIAKTCKCDESCINVKATTEEKLGFTGEKLGIAAHAICLIEEG